MEDNMEKLTAEEIKVMKEMCLQAARWMGLGFVGLNNERDRFSAAGCDITGHAALLATMSSAFFDLAGIISRITSVANDHPSVPNAYAVSFIASLDASSDFI